MRLALLFVAVLSAAPAIACSCIMLDPIPDRELQDEELVLFIGKAVKVEPIPSGQPEADPYFLAGSRTTFAVDRHWEKELLSEVVVESGFPGGGCGYVFEKDKEYVVFAYPDEEKPGTLTTNICRRTAPLGQATKLVEEIDRVLGKGKIPEPPNEREVVACRRKDL